MSWQPRFPLAPGVVDALLIFDKNNLRSVGCLHDRIHQQLVVIRCSWSLRKDTGNNLELFNICIRRLSKQLLYRRGGRQWAQELRRSRLAGQRLWRRLRWMMGLDRWGVVRRLCWLLLDSAIWV